METTVQRILRKIRAEINLTRQSEIEALLATEDQLRSAKHRTAVATLDSLLGYLDELEELEKEEDV